MSEKPKTQCSMCEIEIDVMEVFRGEPMCQECYHEPENYMFGDDKDE